MDINQIFEIFLLAVGILIAGSLAVVTHSTAKRGLSFGNSGSQNSSISYSEMEYDTSESTKDIAWRGFKTSSIFIIIAIFAWLFWAETLFAQQAILFAAIFFLGSYLTGIYGAYSAAKERREKLVTRLQQLGVIYKFKDFQRDTIRSEDGKLHIGWSGLKLEKSKAFFKDAQEGDYFYTFDTGIEKYDKGDPKGIAVIYRAKLDEVVNVGIIGEQISPDTTGKADYANTHKSKSPLS